MWFAIDTLEYLRRGGRIGAARAWLGSALQIKPILTLEEEITPVERVRTRRRVFERLVQYAQELHDEGRDAWVVQHIHDAENAAAAASSAAARCSAPTPLFVSEVGPVIGAHTGPGLLGVGGVALRPARPRRPGQGSPARNPRTSRSNSSGRSRLGRCSRAGDRLAARARNPRRQPLRDLADVVDVVGAVEDQRRRRDLAEALARGPRRGARRRRAPRPAAAARRRGAASRRRAAQRPGHGVGAAPRAVDPGPQVELDGGVEVVAAERVLLRREELVDRRRPLVAGQRRAGEDEAGDELRAGDARRRGRRGRRTRRRRASTGPAPRRSSSSARSAPCEKVSGGSCVRP